MIEVVNYVKIMKKGFQKDEKDFRKNGKCYICGKKYFGDDVRVKEHCHATEKY